MGGSVACPSAGQCCTWSAYARQLVAHKLSFVQEPAGHAFISYVREDSGRVDELQRSLEAAGVPVWRDTAALWPGQDWRRMIRRAITDDALVFIACFSSQSVARERSYQNEELALAITQLRLRQPDDPWLIPVRFDDCLVPDFDIGADRTLASIQRADLFGDRYEEQMKRLVMFVRRLLAQRRPGQDAGANGTSEQREDAQTFPEERSQDERAVFDQLQRAVVPRTPIHESIARGLGTHAQESARRAAAQLAAEKAAETRRERIAQAKADLQEIFSEALKDLQAIEPDATLRSGPDGLLTLSAAGVRLRIEIWEGMTTSEPVPDDTMILAAGVMITNPRYAARLNSGDLVYENTLRSANLVYEQAGDRLGWQVYRFRSSALVAPAMYRYGPSGRTHGLDDYWFFNSQERYFMIHPVMHVWDKTVVALTTDTALELFQEAVDLRPPDPRTGIWPSDG